MSALRHTAVIFGGVLLLVGVPYLCTGHLQSTLNGADAVSGASVVVDKPSGDYVVLINAERHSAGTLPQWEDFFCGREVSYILEDVACTAALSDPGAVTMAESYRSRLPENQMTLRTEDATLMLSKAENGAFDTIIMSAEAYAAYGAQSVDAIVLEVKGAEE